VFLMALAASALIVGVCAACNTWSFWIAKETVHALLALALGIEVAWRVFTPLPEARRVARSSALAVGLLTVAVLIFAPHDHPAVALLPALAGGLACFYAGTALTMMSFYVPADPLHKVVLLGLSPYMVLYAAIWPGARDPRLMAAATWAAPIVLLFALLLLLRAAPPAPSWLVRWLWPWH
jgi:hypothetical protein